MKKLLKQLLLNVAPLVAGVAITISYLPQIYLTYTTKNVTGQSLSFWLILDVALFSFVLQQLGMLIYKNGKNYTGLGVQFLNLLFSLLMTIMVILFR